MLRPRWTLAMLVGASRSLLLLLTLATWTALCSSLQIRRAMHHLHHCFLVLASMVLSICLVCAASGHYVVISGYDTAEDCFSICDPALAIGHIRIPSGMLETARTAFGTDEDLLIIPRPLLLKRTGLDEDSDIMSIQTLEGSESTSCLIEDYWESPADTAGSATLC